MDRQAWIAVTLCVVGFVALQVYNAKNMPPPRAGGRRLADAGCDAGESDRHCVAGAAR